MRSLPYPILHFVYPLVLRVPPLLPLLMLDAACGRTVHFSTVLALVAVRLARQPLAVGLLAPLHRAGALTDLLHEIHLSD